MPPHTSTFVFFFNDTATTEIYTLSLHDALPISRRTADSACRARQHQRVQRRVVHLPGKQFALHRHSILDRKSTRLNSSHGYISYAVFCLKKKKPPLPRPLPRPQRVQRATPTSPP